MRSHPSIIKKGDHLSDYGFTMKVEHITVVCYTDKQLESAQYSTNEYDVIRDHSIAIGSKKERLPVFIFRGSFVEGDEKQFNYFRERISSGERCGEIEEFAALQGNERRPWYHEAK